MPAMPSLPGMNMIPSLTGGAGGSAGPAGGTANNGLSLPWNTPFNFDDSGWVVNLHSNGASTTAGGNTGANQNTQTSDPRASSSDSGQAMSSGPVAALMAGGNTMPLILGALGVFLILTHRL